MTTFEWVCFEGVFRLEGVSGKPLRLTVKHRWLHFEWVLLWKLESQERDREHKLLSSLLLWTNRIFIFLYTMIWFYFICCICTSNVSTYHNIYIHGIRFTTTLCVLSHKLYLCLSKQYNTSGCICI